MFSLLVAACGNGAVSIDGQSTLSDLSMPVETRDLTQLVAEPDLQMPSGALSGVDAGPVFTDVTVTLNPAVRHQTLVGLGAAVVYYTNFLANRNGPADDIYQVLFNDLGLDIIRLGNWYQNQITTGATTATPFGDDDAVTVIAKATASMGHAPLIEMSSWSPPSYLKSNNATQSTTQGTLLSVSGNYQYAQFGTWWASALGAYAQNGIHPDYISIQNEPDYFNSGWQTCLFDAVENPTHAGYSEAVGAVYDAIQASALSPKPQIIATEVTGIAGQNVQNYFSKIDASKVGGIAHHLYNGGDNGNDPSPDSFNSAMTLLGNAATAASRPLFMTEFSPTTPSMFNTAWLIHNAFTVEGVASYIYWELIWAPSTPPAALVTLLAPGNYAAGEGYTINDMYYALKHFSRWTDPGWVRVDISSSASGVKASAFVSPDGKSATIVLLNTDSGPHTVAVAPGSFVFGTSAAYRTSGTTERTTAVAFDGATNLQMPGQSIATVTLSP